MTWMHVQYRRLAWLTAGAAGLLTGLGMLGSVAPRLDALAAFRWHGGALLLLSMCAAFWPRRAVAIGLASPVVILGLPILLALRPAAITAPAKAAAAVSSDSRTAFPHALRVVTFNTWDAADNADEIAGLLRKVGADIAVLVELSPPKRALLDMLKPDYPYQVQCTAIWQCSMAMVSRVPFEAQGVLQANLTMAATVWGRIAGEAGGLTIVGVHIHRPTRSTRLHWGHMRGVAQFARSVRGDLVVAGDFNTPHWAASMSWLRRQTGLREMPRVLPTWPSWPLTVPQFPIDHILASAGVEIADVATGPASGSDHLPIIGTLRLQQVLHPTPPAASAARHSAKPSIISR